MAALSPPSDHHIELLFSCTHFRKNCIQTSCSFPYSLIYCTQRAYTFYKLCVLQLSKIFSYYFSFSSIILICYLCLILLSSISFGNSYYTSTFSLISLIILIVFDIIYRFLALALVIHVADSILGEYLTFCLLPQYFFIFYYDKLYITFTILTNYIYTVLWH